jgi:hypothetical protein
LNFYVSNVMRNQAFGTGDFRPFQRLIMAELSRRAGQ